MPIYMKVPGVEGEVVAAGHKGWIELQSCQLGAHRTTTATGRTGREASVPAFSEIVVTKSQDASSTGLFRLSLWGEGKKFEIDFIKLEDKLPCTYLSLELENTLISSYSISGHGGSVRMTDRWSRSRSTSARSRSIRRLVPRRLTRSP